MPLYRNKIVSQKSVSHRKLVDSAKTESTKNIFRSPLLRNDESITTKKNKEVNISDKLRALTKNHENLIDGMLQEKNIPIKNDMKIKRLKKKLNEALQHKHKNKENNDGTREGNHLNKTENILVENKIKSSQIKEVGPIRKGETASSDICNDAKKEKLVDIVVQKAVKNKKPDINNNNNGKIDQNKRRNKAIHKSPKHTNKPDSCSDLDQSVILLWSQQEIASIEPPKNLSYQERLLWLQEQRNVGLYVCCDKCDKYRYLKDTIDPLDLPEKWYCYMNPDKQHSKCSDPEVEIQAWEEEDLIHNVYHAGSIVWARLDGYPWWPAMVDDDPDTAVYYWLENTYSCIPTYYHVVFFDSAKVTRAWLKPESLHKFKDNVDNPVFQVKKRNMFMKRIDTAKEQAKEALRLSVPDRLKKYSFIARWTGPIHTPKDFIEEKTAKRKVKSKKEKVRVRKTKNEIGKVRNDKYSRNLIETALKEMSDQDFTKHFNSKDCFSPDLFGDNEKLIDDKLIGDILSSPDLNDLVI